MGPETMMIAQGIVKRSYVEVLFILPMDISCRNMDHGIVVMTFCRATTNKDEKIFST